MKIDSAHVRFRLRRSAFLGNANIPPTIAEIVHLRIIFCSQPPLAVVLKILIGIIFILNS